MKTCLKCGFKPGNWGNTFPEIDQQVGVRPEHIYSHEYRKSTGRVVDVVINDGQFDFIVEFPGHVGHDGNTLREPFYQSEIYPL